MKQVHNQEKEQFKELFRQENIDSFEERFKVLEAFLQTEHHVTVAELVEIVDKNGYKAKPDFVRDTLKLMCRFGFARTNRFDNGKVCYEHRHLGQHHDHMVCTKCRKIVEFHDEQLERLQAQIAEAYDFHMLQHKMEIYGICSRCLKDRVQLISLVAAKQGERLIIKDFTGGAKARMRLLTMGLRLDDEIEVITNQGKGRLVVAADYKRYALGRGLAQKILVQPKKDEKIKGTFVEVDI